MKTSINFESVTALKLLAILILSLLTINFATSTAQAAAPTVTEYSAGITPGAGPNFITTGPDGNLWFTESAASKIGKITPSGVVTEYSAGITPGSYLADITTGPDGNLWFSADGVNQIGKITPSGVVTEYSAGITPSAGIYAMTAGPDGNVWFAEYGFGYSGSKIGKITPSGVVTEYSITAGARPYDITTGSDGNVWFVEYDGNRVGKITPSGVVTEYSAGITPGSNLNGITAGPDGNIWFTGSGTDKIGKITPSGVVTEYSALDQPAYITSGHDGNLWFTTYTDKIGRITPSGVVTDYSAGITPGAGIYANITAGPDGNIWFAEYNIDKIGRINLIPTINNPDNTTTTTVSSEYNFSDLDYTVVSGQTLILDGTLCDVTVQSGGTLQGTGTACNITVEPGGTINPGNSPGCLASGNLALSGTYTAELAGTTACTGHDQIQITGTVTAGGTLTPSLLSGFVPTVGNTFTLIDNDSNDAVTGTFTGLAEGAAFTNNGVTYQISYLGGTGNDVVLSVTAVASGAGAPAVPSAPDTGAKLLLANPSTIALITTILAFLLMMIQHRYRKLYNR